MLYEVITYKGKKQRGVAMIEMVMVTPLMLLLVMVYRSVTEALHVLLAVPFALTGGVYLLYS